MAVTVTIEFTDAQWALIEKYYPHVGADGSTFQAITADELKQELFNIVQAEVNSASIRETTNKQTGIFNV